MTPDERPATPPETATATGRSFFARHPWIIDNAIAAVYGLPTVLMVVVTLVTGRSDWGSDPLKTSLAIAGSAIVLVALYLRRRHPLVLVFATGIGILFVTPVFEGLSLIPSAVALYGAAVYIRARVAFVSFAALSAVRIVADLVAQGGDLGASLAMSTAAVFFMLIATLVGVNVGNRRRYVEALIDRAAQLARERDQQAQLSAASERARIAREMHDIVAHSLTVMVALADGADRTVGLNPERAQEAIRRVAETGRVALADMRIVLGVLAPDAPGNASGGEASGPGAQVEGEVGGPGAQGAGAGALAPQPGHDDLDALVASYRSAGMVVVYTVTGAIVADPGIQLAVYRIVQEALTNSLRYAPDPKHVVVTVVYAADGVTVAVADQGQSQLAAPSIGTGHGVVGMRERARGYGGTLEAGPTTAGGWRVQAQIPIPIREETV